jgi:hypothetical protein
LIAVYKQRFSALAGSVFADAPSKAEIESAEANIPTEADTAKQEAAARLAKQADEAAARAQAEAVAAVELANKMALEAEAKKQAEAAADRQQLIYIGVGVAGLFIMGLVAWLLLRRRGDKENITPPTNAKIEVANAASAEPTEKASAEEHLKAQLAAKSLSDQTRAVEQALQAEQEKLRNEQNDLLRTQQAELDRLKAELGSKTVAQQIKNTEQNIDSHSPRSIGAPAKFGDSRGISLSSMKFLFIYLGLMLPTYLIRWAAFSSALTSGDASGKANTANVMLAFLLLGMCCIAFLRGRTTGKLYLVAFPIVAFVFDLFLAFVPFVPTLMHIIAIVVGVPETEFEKRGVARI